MDSDTRLSAGARSRFVRVSAPAPRPARFALVGASGVVVNAAALWALHIGAHVPLVAAAVLATETAIVSNFTGNNFYTFGHRRWSMRRLLKFNASSLVAGGLAVGVLSLLTGTTRMHYLLADLVGIATGAAVNYMVSSRLIWRRSHHETPPLRGDSLYFWAGWLRWPFNWPGYAAQHSPAGPGRRNG
jgi:dolichol-phosphate mannosyltransferase